MSEYCPFLLWCSGQAEWGLSRKASLLAPGPCNADREGGPLGDEKEAITWLLLHLVFFLFSSILTCREIA